MSVLSKNSPIPNEKELDIIAGAKKPTKKELKDMREKFKNNKEIIEAIKEDGTID